MPQPRASRRGAPMKFARNFTILAVAARQLCQTQRKRACEFKTLVCTLLPSFAFNDALRRCPGVVPGFRYFRATLNFKIFQLFAFFRAIDESLLEI